MKIGQLELMFGIDNDDYVYAEFELIGDLNFIVF